MRGKLQTDCPLRKKRPIYCINAVHYHFRHISLKALSDTTSGAAVFLCSAGEGKKTIENCAILGSSHLHVMT